MDNIREKIEELTRRINDLANQQSAVSRQLVQLINELELLKKQLAATETVKEEPLKTPEKVIEFKQPIEAPVPKKVVLTPIEKKQPVKPATAKTSTGFEEFIGKNLASKVGILVTIIGVFIGAKYAIDHDLVSPVVRIISGYLCGGVLIALAGRLKKKYEGYSAVLMGGGIAVLYFITFIAYSFYALIPQMPAFIIMLLFTVGTVYMALLYNQVIIAHLGLVGAYAIPFLLSNNSGRYEILFTYIAIINAGILILSFRKYWKSLFYAAFIVTWLIYGAWHTMSYEESKHFTIAFLFLSVYFITFYATFLAYKLIRKEQYNFSDVTILLSNSFIFYGFGYALLQKYIDVNNSLGIFTVINAFIHLAVSVIIRRLKLADTALYFFTLGLVIVFLTIAIPVQLDGNWVTLLWTAEAVMVFIIGRTRQSAAYEKIGCALILLSFLSLWQDWLNYVSLYAIGDSEYSKTPFRNIIFASGILVCVAQGIIIYINRSKKYISALPEDNFFRGVYNYVVPVFFLICSYFVFLWELIGYFEHVHSIVSLTGRPIGEVWSVSAATYILYTLVYLLLLFLVNRRYGRSNALPGAALILSTIVLLVLLLIGLPVLNKCSYNYYLHKNNLYFGILNLFMRYIVAAATAGLLYFARLTIATSFKDGLLHNGWSILTHVVALGFISAEYLHLTTVSGADNQYKLGLSIVWGLYALILIIAGIWKKRKFLRLSAIILFGVVLIKLFVYDLAEAGTITKTISFISLGAILLLVSYLYNRYKEILFGDDIKKEV